MSQTEWSTIEPIKAEQEKIEYEIEGEEQEQQTETAAPEQKEEALFYLPRISGTAQSISGS